MLCSLLGNSISIWLSIFNISICLLNIFIIPTNHMFQKLPSKFTITPKLSPSVKAMVAWLTWVERFWHWQKRAAHKRTVNWLFWYLEDAISQYQNQHTSKRTREKEDGMSLETSLWTHSEMKQQFQTVSSRSEWSLSTRLTRSWAWFRVLLALSWSPEHNQEQPPGHTGCDPKSSKEIRKQKYLQ